MQNDSGAIAECDVDREPHPEGVHLTAGSKYECAFDVAATHQAARPPARRACHLGHRQHVVTANQPSHARFLHVEADLEDVAVAYFVVLALDPQLLQLARLRPRADLEELAPVDHLGPDESSLEVAVDDARAFGRLRTGAKGPRARLVLAGGEERQPAEKVVRG